MGLIQSQIKNRDNIIVLPNNKIMRIMTYNINQMVSIYSKKNIKHILNYVIKIINNESCDIVALQGIYGWENIYDVYEMIKKNKINIIPEFDKNNDNIILTRHKIKSFGTTEITNINGENIYGRQYCCCVNIEIYGKIISIYNTMLPGDIHNIKNTEIRSMEINNIVNIVNDNIKHLNETYKKNKNLNVSDIHILMGCLNVINNENKKSQEAHLDIYNTEYENMLSVLKAIDIHELLDSDNTTIYKTRISYGLLMQMNDTILNLIENNYNINNIFNKIYNDYGIFPIKAYVDKNILLSDNYPLIIVFMIKQNNL